MYTLVLLLYLQRGVDVTLDGARLRGAYQDKRACDQAALALRGPVPIPGGYAAAWQEANCIRIARGVRVRDGPPLDLGQLLASQPPRACQGEGTWRRLAQLCARR